ncbi:MAG: hypothetical protein AAFQ98_24175 [Bacteroidota bacterium]
MEDKHAIAEQLENRRLTLIRLCFSGFALGGGARLLAAYVFPTSAALVFPIIQAIGGMILLISLLQLWALYIRVKKDKVLQEAFHDELLMQTKLKSRQAGYFVLLALQLVLLPFAFFYTVPGLLVVELGIYVGVIVALGTRIIQEEFLTIARSGLSIDREKYQVWNWQHPTFIHYVLNPGLVVNELLMGQRISKVMLIDKESPRPLAERSYVPCPSCGTLHTGSVWSAQNGTAFRNWYGLYCPSCGDTIPCLRNIFSWLVIMLTYPLWFWKQEAWKAKWLEKQPERFQNYTTDTEAIKRSTWWKMGLGFGVFMFVVMTFVLKAIALPFTDVEGDYLGHFFDPKFLLVNGVAWTLAGFLFGAIMWFILGRKGKADGEETQGQVS